MAKANAQAGTTVYVAVGDPVPDWPGVRLVGPGAPVEPQAPARPIINAPKAAWVNYAVSQGADRSEAESLLKGELLDLYGP